MSDIWWLRIAIVVAGLLLIGAIWIFGGPRKQEQGKRRSVDERHSGGDRLEPSFATGSASAPLMDDAATHETAPVFRDSDTPMQSGPELGKRSSEDFDKIVTLYIAARAGHQLRGSDIMVAAEKAGLVYGYMNVFHRLVDGRPDSGPIFSVANVKKPGSFDMADIQAMETPAIAFFLTLPAPISALDAWDAMQPAAERMAHLLDGVLLDESRNALGRQRIQHIREEMRVYDRQREVTPAKPARW